MSKQRQVLTPEFRRSAVERMLAGENIHAMARQLGVLRKSLYEWKDNYLSESPTGWARKLATPGQKAAAAKGLPGAVERAELSQAHERIAELERKVGKQELELDFFAAALQRIQVMKSKSNEKRSMKSSPSDPCKAH